MPTPHEVIGFKFAIDGFSLLFAVLQIISTRKRQGNRYTTAANTCLFLTFAADLTATGIFVYIMTEEHRIINLYHGDPQLVNKAVGDPSYTKIFFIAHFFYYLSLYFLKLAYLSHYAQLFVRTQTKKKAALYIASVVTFLGFLSGIMLQLLWCQPLSDNWNPLTKNTNCPTLFNHQAFAILAWINIVSDLFIIAVPMLIISDLRLSRREKWGLLGIFLVGGSSILASIIRYVVVGKKIINMEFNWHTLHVFALVSHAEVLFGIVAFTMPAFRPFFRRFIGDLTPKFTSAHSKPVISGGSADKQSAASGTKQYAQVCEANRGEGDEALIA